MSNTIMIPAEEEIYDLSEFYKVFGDSTRIKILYVLRQQELCVNDIAVHDPKFYFPSASHPEAASSGEIPPGRKDHLLFSGR